MGDRDRLRVRVLGTVEARIGGNVVALGGSKQRALLALLLTRPGRTYPTDELIDALWHDEPPEGAATTIRSYVSRLRSALDGEASVSATAAGYALEVDPGNIDATDFEHQIRAADEALREGRPREAGEQLTSALSLWRGRPFGELADDGALRVEADRLEELRLHALERRLEADIEIGRAAEVVDAAEALTRQFPFRERLWQLLMLALYHSGRQADALDAYQRARKQLDEQLGIDPSPELQALEAAVLRHELARPGGATRPDRLPPQLTRFVGRESELEHLRAELSEARLVTLIGVGGVGKTRLALELARGSLELAADWRVFVDIAPAGNADEVLRAVAHALDVRDQPGQPLSSAIARDIGSARLLLILDNCEQAAEGAALLADQLIRACPNVRIVATSRMPLGVEGEVDYAVQPLALPRSDATDAEIADSEAVRLLFERSHVSARSPASDATAIAAAARICRDLDGLPLAIELAAARSRSLSLPEIAAHLDDRFRFLVSWRRVSSGRHQTLRQAMDWSHDLLAARDRELFEALCIFNGGFNLAAAVAVATASHDEVIDSVARLVDASLVMAETDQPETRYRMLETVREYGLALLAERGQSGAVRDRHASYFARVAELAEPELSGADQAEWFRRLELEHANLVAALDHLERRGDEHGLLEFTIRLTRFWYVRGHLDEARHWLERALAAATGTDPALRRRALTAAASIALLQGDYDAATAFAESSLEAARETGEDRLVANGLSNLGAIRLAAGDTSRAGELLIEAVALGRTIDDTRIRALALNNLADYELTVGAYARAEPLFSESLELLRARGDTANVARSLFNLGAVALRLNQPDEAEARLVESLGLSREIDDKEDLCWALIGLAALAAARGRGERAANLLGAAERLLDEMGAAFKAFERSLHDDAAAGAESLLGASAYAEAQAAGRRMFLAEALDIAVSD
ncbi:MAG TPA: BTAD domain-containing putative transcriptional regulator [Candidatus Limnocylindrales bacterium]